MERVVAAGAGDATSLGFLNGERNLSKGSRIASTIAFLADFQISYS